MKIVFIGGGAHRYLGVARAIMHETSVMDNGEISIFDINVERAFTMGEMIKKTPEYSKINCIVSYDNTIEDALLGADVVCVVLMAGDMNNFLLGNLLCSQHGFIGSDQLSPNGAMLALKGGKIVMDIAQKMERLCPGAWLINFANPVAVISAAVNNHTNVKCLGVCAGYTNHMWDIPRILGKDEQAIDADINCVGINHMSFISSGYIYGKDVYDQLRETITENWQMPMLSDRWNTFNKENITNSVNSLVKLYRKYGYMVFSSEGDGLAHLDIEGYYSSKVKDGLAYTKNDIANEVQARSELAKQRNEMFSSFLNHNFCDGEWDCPKPESLYLLREDQNIMVKIIKAIAGIADLKIATSFVNNGAVDGFTDRTVLEYSQIISSKGITPVSNLKLPEIFRGLVTSLANHQTLLGDAIATNDPKVLFSALYSYPIHQDTRQQKDMWIDLLELNKDELPSDFQYTKNYLIY